jgi:hypothetical protein
MGLMLVKISRNKMLNGQHREGSRATGCIPLVCIKNIVFDHTPQDKKCSRTIQSVQFYNYPNTDIYWQIFATSVVLGRE